MARMHAPASDRIAGRITDRTADRITDRIADRTAVLLETMDGCGLIATSVSGITCWRGVSWSTRMK